MGIENVLSIEAKINTGLSTCASGTVGVFIDKDVLGIAEDARAIATRLRLEINMLEEAIKHDTLAKKQAYTQLAKDVRNVKMIKPGKHMDRLAREIKCAFGIREEYENTKAFVKEHRDFYLDDKPSKKRNHRRSVFL